MADAIDSKINRVSLFDYFILDGQRLLSEGTEKRGTFKMGRTVAVLG
jgi:hypothetical protein